MSIYDKASLVLIPSGTKTSKVYSQKPTNGDGDFTFSRSTAATRVNASGNIEKETGNLVLWSEDLTQSDWTKSSVSVTADAEVAPNGTTTADKVTHSAATGAINQTISVMGNGVFTYSFYAKYVDTQWIRPAIGTNSDYLLVWFDIQNGVLGTNASAGGSVYIDSSITDVGNGWYRCSLTAKNGSLTGNYVQSNTAGADGSNPRVIGSFLYWGIQLEQGLVARDYIETTTTAIYGGITDNVPRLDYTDSSCPALLLEPQRTNRITHSEYSGVYSTQGLVSLTDNFATSPEGYNNAFRATPTTSNVQHIFFRSGMGGAADTYTQSIFAKANGYNFCFIRFDLPTRYAFFDLQNGTTAYTDSEITSTITDMGNGWYRCTATMTTTQYANAVIGVAEAGDSQADKDFAGDGASSVLFYGHQSEEASYATSYIPTYGSAVTRNEDSATAADQINNQTAFSAYIEFDSLNKTSQGDGQDMIVFGSTAGGYWLRLYPYYTNEAVRWLIRGPSISNNVYFNYNPATTSIKTCVVYNGVSTKFFFNGTLVYTETGETYPISTGGNITIDSAAYKGFHIFNTSLTDQEAIDLTTL